MLKTNGARLQATQSYVQDSAQKLATQFDNMQPLLTKLAQSHNGDAPHAWQSLQKDWDTATQEMERTIDATKKALQQALEAYQATERRPNGMWA